MKCDLHEWEKKKKKKAERQACQRRLRGDDVIDDD